jgi:hypothetical protein
MKLSFKLFFFLAALAWSSCVYKSTRDDNWVYFEDWDMNHDSKIDSAEFVAGYIRDDFQKDGKGSAGSEAPEKSAQTNFATSDENGDGFVTGLEFYHWQLNVDAVPARDTAASVRN